MKTAVIGLGLIGGSLCKTIQKHTDYPCYGIDLDPQTIAAALESKAIDKAISPEELSAVDLSIVALHPRQTITFLLEHVQHFKKGSIVIDTCGIKEEVVKQVSPVFAEHGVTFVGCHPMAGREFSGFAYALDDLFDRASFIITPTEDTPAEAVATVAQFATDLHFKKVVTATPREHDEVIAFTSQLAHVVSNAYIKSPTLQRQCGFSAGSFLDLTRVAKLNENMWSALFMLNREPLLAELNTLMAKLEEYKNALENEDETTLKELLREGRILKEESLKNTHDDDKH